VSGPETSTVDINGFPTWTWRQGDGPPLGFLAGFGGLPRWMPALDRLAERRTAVAPSLPGSPGGGRGHTALDTHLDRLLATRPLLDAAGAEAARAARIFQPLGDARLAERSPLIEAPILLLRGEPDRPVPPSYARRFVEHLGGPAETRTIPGAAHPAELDRPSEVARAVLD